MCDGSTGDWSISQSLLHSCKCGGRRGLGIHGLRKLVLCGPGSFGSFLCSCHLLGTSFLSLLEGGLGTIEMGFGSSCSLGCHLRFRLAHAELLHCYGVNTC